MNAGAETACTALSLGFHVQNIDPSMTRQIKVAAFRSLEWSKEIVMISFYQAFTRLAQCFAVLKLHDDLWITEKSVKVLYVQHTSKFFSSFDWKGTSLSYY